MHSCGQRPVRNLTLASLGLLVLTAGCSPHEAAEISTPLATEPAQVMEDVSLFGAADPAAQADTPFSDAAAPPWRDAVDAPLPKHPPPIARPLADL